MPEVTEIPAERREDPAYLRTNGEDGYRDGCRVPIPWTDDAATNYGFSSSAGKLAWLPQPISWSNYCINLQQVDPNSSLKFYQRALKLRKELANLGDGTLSWIDNESADYLAFTRGDLIIATNTSGTTQKINVPANSQLRLASDDAVSLQATQLVLPADTAAWLQFTL